MSKKEAKQPRPWKYYARDCRGRFIKRSKKTAADIAEGIERMHIGPTWMYVQLDCEETNFKKAWRRYGVYKFCTKAGLSLSPWLKTWKVRVSGHFLRKELIDDPGIYWKDCSAGSEIITYDGPGTLLPYAQVVALRQSSSNPLHVSTDYTKYNTGPANIGANNVGIRNFGYYNLGIEVMGIFNTDPTCFYMFNKPCDMGISAYDIYKEFPFFLRDISVDTAFPKPSKYEGPLESFKRHKEDPDWPEQHKQLLSLPNFDYGIFEEITGISKEMLAEADKAWKKKYGKKGR